MAMFEVMIKKIMTNTVKDIYIYIYIYIYINDYDLIKV
jgi:hypothetical protein